LPGTTAKIEAETKGAAVARSKANAKRKTIRGAASEGALLIRLKRIISAALQKKDMQQAEISKR
jgi:hypothetical protein